MKQYNIFQAIFMSFYSKDLYRDVAAHWGAKVFLYLLMILALSWILPVTQVQLALNLAYSQNSDKIVDQMPVITIKDGKVSTPENRPYVITSPTTKENVVVIDTSGQYTTLEQAKASVLLTETAVIMQSDPHEIKTYQIHKDVNMVVNPKVISAYVQDYLGYVWIPLFIALLLVAYLYRIFQALIYAVIGLLFGAIAGTSLTYGQIVQITLVAITPALILSCVLDALAITFPYQILLYFVITMVYLCYGVCANKPPKNITGS